MTQTKRKLMIRNQKTKQILLFILWERGSGVGWCYATMVTSTQCIFGALAYLSSRYCDIHIGRSIPRIS